jgi:hypothetical protein
MHTMHLLPGVAIQPNLRLKTWPKQLLGSLSLVLPGISEMKSKQQRPCSNCIHQPVMSWENACSTCMHKPLSCMHRPVMSQDNACTYCMGSKVSSLSWIYLNSSYFDGPVFSLFSWMSMNSSNKFFVVTFHKTRGLYCKTFYGRN